MGYQNVDDAAREEMVALLKEILAELKAIKDQDYNHYLATNDFYKFTS